MGSKQQSKLIKKSNLSSKKKSKEKSVKLKRKVKNKFRNLKLIKLLKLICSKINGQNALMESNLKLR